MGFKESVKVVSKNETLVLDCGSDDCFAVITYNVLKESNSAKSCLDTGKVDQEIINLIFNCFITRSKLLKRCI